MRGGHRQIVFNETLHVHFDSLMHVVLNLFYRLTGRHAAG